jgi:hypothetical protein
LPNEQLKSGGSDIETIAAATDMLFSVPELKDNIAVLLANAPLLTPNRCVFRNLSFHWIPFVAFHASCSFDTTKVNAFG